MGPALATTRAPAPRGALQPGPTGYDAYPSVAEEKCLGHYCGVCGRTRATERFSGRGHARHICRDCQRLPREERDRVRSLLEIEGFLEQQNISAKNVARLKTLARSPDEEVRRKAGLVLEVGHLAPGKRKRHSTLAKRQPDLLNRLVEQGLVFGDPAEPARATAGGDDDWEDAEDDVMPPAF
jgi:hypothetical protein